MKYFHEYLRLFKEFIHVVYLNVRNLYRISAGFGRFCGFGLIFICNFAVFCVIIIDVMG